MELNKIVNIIAKHYEILPEYIGGKSRSGVIMEARKHYYLLAYQLNLYSKQRIVNYINRSDHTTLSKVIPRINKLLETNEKFKENHEILKKKLNDNYIELIETGESIKWVAMRYILDTYKVSSVSSIGNKLNKLTASGDIKRIRDPLKPRGFLYDLKDIDKLFAKIVIESKQIYYEPPIKTAYKKFKFENRIGIREDLLNYLGIAA